MAPDEGPGATDEVTLNGRFVWRDWMEEVAVYDRASGDTLVLTAACAALVGHLAEQPGRRQVWRDLVEAFESDEASDTAVQEPIGHNADMMRRMLAPAVLSLVAHGVVEVRPAERAGR